MKFKKFMAVSMAAMLATASLAACGSDDETSTKKKESKINSFKASIEEGIKMEKYEYSFDLNARVAGNEVLDEEMATIFGGDGKTLDFTIKTTGVVDKDNNKCKIGIDVNDKIKADFIEVLYVDGEAFFNLEMLTDGIVGLAKDMTGEDFSEQVKAEMPEGEYIKLTSAQLEELSEAVLGMSVEEYSNSIKEVMESEENKELQEMMDFFVELVDKSAKKADLYSKDGDKYTVKINDKNIDDFIAALADVVNSDKENVAEKINSLGLAEEVSADDIELLTTMLKTYKFGDMLKESGLEFEIEVSTEYTDSKWAVGASIELKAEGNEVEIGVAYEAKTSEDASIKAPTDLVDAEFTEEVVEGIISSMNTIDEDIYTGALGLDDTDDTDDTDDIDDTDDNDVSEADEEFFGFSYAGKQFTFFESTLNDVKAAGLEFEEDFAEKDDSYSVHISSVKENVSFTGYNEEMEEMECGEYKVGSILLGNFIDKEVEPYKDFEFVKGLKIGSTYDEMVEILGETDDVEEYTTTTEYSYEFKCGENKVEYEITVLDDCVINMSIYAY